MTLWKLVLRNLLGRKWRFWLTLIGMTVSISSFVALLTLGRGLQDEISRQTQQLGGVLLATPKGWCAYEQISVLTGEQLPEAIPFREVEKISALPGLTAVPYLTEKTSIENNPVPVIGILPEKMKQFRGWELATGGYLQEGDDKSVVVGAAIAQQFHLPVGKMVTIRRREFPVKGILKETGTQDDLGIFMPLRRAQGLYGVGDHVSFVAVKVQEVARLEEYRSKIQEVANVAVISDKQLARSVLAIIGTTNVTLQLIAGVAIVAAAFGITNTMTTAVYERKREIGILQAIGATQTKIFFLFLLEALGYGFLGGLLGTGIGIGISLLGAPYLSQNEFIALFKGSQVGVDWSTLVFPLLFSLTIAFLSGVYPAYRASCLTPVEAIVHQ